MAKEKNRRGDFSRDSRQHIRAIAKRCPETHPYGIAQGRAIHGQGVDDFKEECRGKGIFSGRV